MRQKALHAEHHKPYSRRVLGFVVQPTAENPVFTGQRTQILAAQILFTDLKEVFESMPQKVCQIRCHTECHAEHQNNPTQIAELATKMKMPGCSVVTVGDTGAGKSTLLNALLGETNILPTNGMRACTASVIELSWNERLVRIFLS